jgi:gluconokinase
MAGERSPNWNLAARGVFFGLTLEHEAKHLARALLEGIAFRFRSLNEMLVEAGLDIRQVHASGGFTKSTFWLQLMADVLGRELKTPAWGDTSSLGAAFWAMRAAGLGGELENASSWVELGQSYQPNPAGSAVYDRLYPIFADLYRATSPLFDQLAQFNQQNSKKG